MLDANISYTRFSLLIHIRDISMHFAISRVNIMYICITFVILRSKELNKAKIMFIVAIFVKQGGGGRRHTL